MGKITQLVGLPADAGSPQTVIYPWYSHKHLKKKSIQYRKYLINTTVINIFKYIFSQFNIVNA